MEPFKCTIQLSLTSFYNCAMISTIHCYISYHLFLSLPFTKILLMSLNSCHLLSQTCICWPTSFIFLYSDFSGVPRSKHMCLVESHGYKNVCPVSLVSMNMSLFWICMYAHSSSPSSWFPINSLFWALFQVL